LSSSLKVNHAPIGGPKILSLARRRRWLGAPSFGLFRDNYKMLSERMNVLLYSMHTVCICIHTCTVCITIYLPCRKLLQYAYICMLASDFRKVKTAVQYAYCTVCIYIIVPVF
jgi:hypothetical protein